MATISSCCRIINHGAFDLLSKRINHNSSLSFSQHSRLNLGASNCKSFQNSRLRCSYIRNKALEKCHVLPKISCLFENSSESNLEEEEEEEERQSFVSETSQKEGAIDLKLPRRSLLVTFTCDACETRSERLINRLAYERGLVYVQCSGCSKYHKLVDNLGLVVEYNLQDEIDSSTSTDHV